jgi:hypothetical protein
MKPLLVRAALALACSLAAASASAQLVDPDVDWVEETVPPPPAFDVQRAIPIEMPSFMTLRFGVDPNTITVTQDGVVRYVMVATSTTGVVNAMYEGIRCNTGQVRTYGRFNAGGWEMNKNAPWRGLRDRMPSHHAAAFALQGACEGRAAASSPEKIVRTLRNPPGNAQP